MNLITFNEIPQAVSQLHEEVLCLKEMVMQLLANQNNQTAIDKHTPMSIDEAAAYLRIPKATLYNKLANGDIPGTKATKRWTLYRDELDQWLEASRKNNVPLTPEQANDAILSSHRRKPKNRIA
jgi:excisionase family DNA binding protein